MKTIFEPVSLGRLDIKNRLVRSATLLSGDGKDGLVSADARDELVQLAENEVGLIITSMIGVCEGACATDYEIRAYADGFRESLSDLVNRIHAAGGKIAVQIAHCGAKSTYLEGLDAAESPSGVAIIPNLPTKAISTERIREIELSFAEAALKCKNSGADGVQIHAAHGYLISQFLCPALNHRDDMYGGSLENRARFLVETYAAIREAVGDEYPVLIKINCEDLISGGLTREESVRVCKMLEEKGMDAVEVSVGVGLSPDTRPVKAGIQLDAQGPFADAAAEFADYLNIAVISVCGYRSPEFITEVLNKSSISAVSMSRPFIREYNLAKRWKDGDLSPSSCQSCLACGSKGRRCMLTAEKA